MKCPHCGGTASAAPANPLPPPPIESTLPGCAQLDLDAGTVHLVLDFARDGNAQQMASRFVDLYVGIIHKLRARHGSASIEGLPAVAFADFCSRVDVALRAIEP